jgi:hypothetical protein
MQLNMVNTRIRYVNAVFQQLCQINLREALLKPWKNMPNEG